MKLTTATGAFRAWFTVLIMLVCVGVTDAFTIAYVIKRARDICGIVVLLDDRNQSLPDTTDPDTMKFRRELHIYRQKLGC